MCKNAYEQLSERTNIIMIFCKLLGNDGFLEQLCISQRFCPDKNRYIENEQKKNCKKYEDNERK